MCSTTALIWSLHISFPHQGSSGIHICITFVPFQLIFSHTLPPPPFLMDPYKPSGCQKERMRGCSGQMPDPHPPSSLYLSRSKATFPLSRSPSLWLGLIMINYCLDNQIQLQKVGDDSPRTQGGGKLRIH